VRQTRRTSGGRDGSHPPQQDSSFSPAFLLFFSKAADAADSFHTGKREKRSERRRAKRKTKMATRRKRVGAASHKASAVCRVRRNV
jgi:hypothetical protein